MKKIEIFINRLNFGFFFPLWWIDCRFNYFLFKYGLKLDNLIYSKKKVDKIKQEIENSQGFLTDLQFFCNYNLIDIIYGFSVMFMILLLYDTFDIYIDKYFHPFLSKDNIVIMVFVFIFIVGYVPVYYFFHRRDKREKYFVEFDKEPMRKKWKWAALSWGLFIGSWVSVILIHHYFAR